MPLDGLHEDHERAKSFGSVAQAYERFRPGYPAELFDALLAARVGHVLDVGCGTGKVAVELARRGVPVLGVEPDSRMADVARTNGVSVEVSSFEDWDDAGRRFDLITCGHAWHWIDPLLGSDKAARLLEPYGRIARFWNYHAVDAELLVEFEAIYADLAPTITVIGRDPSDDQDTPDPFAAHPLFTGTHSRTYRWTRQLTARQWGGLLATFGDHHRLPPEVRATLTRELTAAINRHGGVVRIRGGTYLLLARRCG